MKLTGVVLLTAFTLSLVAMPGMAALVHSAEKPVILTLDVCNTAASGVPFTDMPVIFVQNSEILLFDISLPKSFQSFTSHKPVLLTVISHPPQSV
ncbi:hypothetical protein [Candidatus Magnetomonas plexicatena]|uniref:hypothetical protein n=1 Tax=Candidatus Magnetomonas plexicatena TaxID=2552947 RepID=UPI001C73E582|nr:hypothetical protein E2O03_012285 [Nitrospirales bacterium LBB_01]